MKSLKACFIISLTFFQKNLYMLYGLVLLFREKKTWKITNINVINFPPFTFISQIFALIFCVNYISRKKPKSNGNCKITSTWKFPGPVKVRAKAASFDIQKNKVAQPITEYIQKMSECKCLTFHYLQLLYKIKSSWRLGLSEILYFWNKSTKFVTCVLILAFR